MSVRIAYCNSYNQDNGIKEKLEQEENVLKNENMSFIKVADSFASIKNDKLYGATTYRSFEEYIKVRHRNYTIQHVEMLLQARDMYYWLKRYLLNSNKDLPTDFVFYYMLSKLSTLDCHFCIDMLGRNLTSEALHILLTSLDKL